MGLFLLASIVGAAALAPHSQRHTVVAPALQPRKFDLAVGRVQPLPLVLRGGSLQKISRIAVSLVALALAPVILIILMQRLAMGMAPSEPILDPEVWRQVRFEYAKAGDIDAARREAAEKLLSNHDAVLRDMTNKAPRSQSEIKRQPIAVRDLVDRALAEIVRRLAGGRSVPATPREATVWFESAQLLCARLQSTRDDMQYHPHFKKRAPDMSVAAVASMRKVLGEMMAAVPAAAA